MRKSIIAFILCIPVLFADNNQSLNPAWSKLIIRKLEMHNAPVGDVLQLIASRYDINIFVDPSVRQRVSVYLRNASVTDILNYLSEEYGFSYRMHGNILKVFPPRPEKPPCEIIFSSRDSLITVKIEGIPLGEALDSLTRHTGFNFLYSGSRRDSLVNLHLVNATFPAGIFLWFESISLKILRRENSCLLYDSGRKIIPGIYSEEGISITAGNLVSVHVKDRSIRKLISVIGEKMDKDMIIYSAPPGNITLDVNRLGFDELLALILDGTGYTYRKRRGVFIIGDRRIHGIQSVKVVKLKHLKVENIARKIPHYLLENVEINEIKEHNSVSLVGYPEALEDIETFLHSIDKEIPQVLIEAIVVDYDITNQKEIGVKMGVSNHTMRDSAGIVNFIPGINGVFEATIKEEVLDKIRDSFGNVFQIGKLPDNFFMQLKALESIGKANIRSKPHIATLNGHEAELKIGVTQYYKLKTNSYYGGYYPPPSQTQNNEGNQLYPFYPSETERFEKIEATVSLKITPWISGKDEITVEILPDFQTPVHQLNPEVPPTIQSRKLKSTVRLKDGETIVLGGLIQEIEQEQREQVPLLGDLPLIGNLFRWQTKSRQKKEMVIYITPILYKEQVNGLEAYTEILFDN
jgi:type IV pilus assembly protein PilQ